MASVFFITLFIIMSVLEVTAAYKTCEIKEAEEIYEIQREYLEQPNRSEIQSGNGLVVICRSSAKVSSAYCQDGIWIFGDLKCTKTTKSRPEIPHERHKRFFWLIIPVVVCLFTFCRSPAIRDSTPPTISNCPQDIYEEAIAAHRYAFVTWAKPTAWDSKDGTVSDSFNYTMATDTFTQWTHIAFTWNQSKRKSEVFINGLKKTEHVFNTSTGEIEFSTNRILEIKTEAAGWTFTGLVFDGSILSNTVINQLSENCSSNLSSALITMNDVFKADSIDTELSFSKCDVINECETNPCGNDNICINEQNGYSCQCLSGYSGANCDIPPNFCKVNGCKNSATCMSNFANYSCVCDSNFTGSFCETEIVHGNWGSWLDWTECSQSCAGGTQYRTRYCDDPAPDLYGLECSGTNISLQDCNTDVCPVCLSYSTIYSYKNSFNCTSISDSTSCVVTCQDGYSFARDYQPLDQYECGPQTGHIWNAIPPPCVRSDSPRAVRTTATVTYKGVDCSNEESVSATLKQNLDNLQCVENNTCTVSTSTSGCGSRRKRSTVTSVQTIIQIDSELSQQPLILDEFYSNNIVDDPVTDTSMAESSSGNQTLLIVAGVVIGVVFALIVIVSVAYIVRKKCRKSARMKDTNLRSASIVSANMIRPTLDESIGIHVKPIPDEPDNFSIDNALTNEQEMVERTQLRSLPPIQCGKFQTGKNALGKPMLSPIGHASDIKIYNFN